jgi:hypothetical protein
MSNLFDGPIVEQDFDNIKPDLDLRVPQATQIVETGMGKPSTPLGVNCGCRPLPVFRGASFDLDEYETIQFAKDKVDFPSRRAEISRQKFHSEPL